MDLTALMPLFYKSNSYFLKCINSEAKETEIVEDIFENKKCI